jgi:uncharacterized protein YutE (UPF0331/DUF86 family)
MDKHYRDAMIEHITELEEELGEYRSHVLGESAINLMAYRAIERAMQLLIEACIGIAKQSIKGKGKQVPSDARKAFEKMTELGMDVVTSDWKSIIGMRNALVHDYLNLDRDKVLDIIRSNQHRVLIEFARLALKNY